MISFIIPVYNVEGYIDECLKSIFSQTYNAIEVIVVDDGSTDKSVDIIKKYIRQYTNIKLISQNNKGVSEARNVGLKHAMGKYIAFIDPDDYIDQCYAENLIKKLEESGSDIAICSYKKVYDKNEKLDQIINIPIEIEKECDGKRAAELILMNKFQGYVWDKIFIKENLVKHKFEFEYGRYIQDFFPIFREMYKAKKISIIDEPLYYYRQRNTSTVHKKGIKKVLDYAYATDLIYNYSIKKKLDINKINNFKNYTFTVIINQYYINEQEKNEKDFYIKFYKENLGKNEPKLMKVIFNRYTNFFDKIKIILWKLRIYKFLKDISV